MITGQSISEGDVSFRFVPLKEFTALGNVYVPGMQYSVRHQDETLLEAVYKWFTSGKVEIVIEDK